MPDRPVLSPAEASPARTTGKGRDTEYLKQVPETKALREQIRHWAIALAAKVDRSRPLARHEMESHARRLLAGLQLPEAYLGWTMVALASAFWREQVAAVPYHRRLLLLPRCLRNEQACPAPCDASGLLCQDCGACCLSGLRAEARRKGYRVMIAEGSPTVMQIILGGHADALLGVACLDVLEKTLDKILLSGIPCMAVPLLTNGCRNTSADEDWIRRMFDTPHADSQGPLGRPSDGRATVQTRTYLHLMRCAARMFEPTELRRLAPSARGGAWPAQPDGPAIEAMEPVACTEAIAYDFLAAGGKHSRPFITLAVYDAVAAGGCTLADGARQAARLPDALKRVALATEVFHKASLIHDDIEDDDPWRYGRATLHRTYGTAVALNVGDYLIGLGYRLVAGQREPLGADVVADVLAQFARAHTKLCEGQGAELIWRDARDKRLGPADALKIYALKTSPAFEAALLAGIRLARLPIGGTPKRAAAGAGRGSTMAYRWEAEPYRPPATRFARHLGVAYQMLNDLDDWQGDPASNRPAGSDLLGGRPTVLWALALNGLGPKDRRQLESLLADPSRDGARLARAAELYERAGAFEQAAALVAKHHRRARAAAGEVELEPLRSLLEFLAEAILDRRPLTISGER